MSTKTTKTTMKRWLTPVVVPAVVMMVALGTLVVAAAALGTAEGDAAVQQAGLHAQVWQMLTPEQQVAARNAEAEIERRRGQRQQRLGERRQRRQQRHQQQG